VADLPQRLEVLGREPPRLTIAFVGRGVAEPGAARYADASHDRLADLLRVVDALDEPGVRARAGGVRRAAPAAAGRLDDEVAHAEVPLHGALMDLDVLHVFVGERLLLDAPHAAPDAHAPLAEHVPGGVVTQVNRDVGHDIGRHD